MGERLPFEFRVFRYVPDVVKGEFVNIGVMLQEAGEAAPGRAAVRFTQNWSRVRCMDADADVELLEALEAEVGARLLEAVSEKSPKRVMDVLEDTLSNSVQMSEIRGFLAANMTAGLEELSRLYMEPMRVARERAKEKTGRAALTTAMRGEFERARVWQMMRKRIAVSEYTRKGDTLRIDCGYRPNGVIRMFHAVSLDAEVEQAKILSFAAPALRAGVRRVDGADLELTAVVEAMGMVSEPDDEAGERYRFGVETMEREGIRVITANDLARAAATARVELRV